ncbi:MAG: isoaspartyl peptidase/L-asparaginase, partial [Phycisphaerales bacterium]|nr:isoaspartyl peptidase/L-asparaginase [Phycisphaerales bacterium]
MSQHHAPTGAEHARPIMLSTWSFAPVGNVPGKAMLDAGAGGLDAVVHAATLIENDPLINSVGIGGLPDADGRVSLDGCVMTDPNRCGSVAFMREYANVCAIARRVMEKTIHVMLVGKGAEEFAAREGFQRAELLTPAARGEWEKWSKDPRNLDRERYKGWIPPLNVEEVGYRGSEAGSRVSDLGDRVSTPRPETRDPKPGSREPYSHDTVSILAIDSRGQLAGACSTSGMAFKVPGRVGDSPIIGHGLYVDQRGGAAAATGNGELVMGTCGSFLAVELMRRGATPLEAITEVLGRIVDRFEIGPDHQVAMIAVAPRVAGQEWKGWASGAIKPGFH